MSLFRKPSQTGDEESTGTKKETAPSEGEVPSRLPVFPLKDIVVYPGTVVPVFAEGEYSFSAIKQAQAGGKLVAAFTLKSKAKNISPQDLYSVGTASLIHKVLRVSPQGLMVILQGVAKVKALTFTPVAGGLTATVQTVSELSQRTKEVEALTKKVLKLAQEVIGQTPYLPQELQVALEDIEGPVKLVYLVATLVSMKIEEKQQLLELAEVKGKLEKMVEILGHELELLKLGGKLESEIRKDMNKAQKEYFLRQKMKAIKKELGEESESAFEANEYRKKLKKLSLPEEVRKECEKEIDRFAELSSISPQYQVSRTYLDTIFELPWSVETKDNLELERVKKTLDDDHFGLEEVKERIVEYLAVRKLTKSLRGPILCFVGPPGVGKTSLGQSIARALGRKFVRMSLGGMRDEAEIRGHRRTYIGALPGRIIQGIKRAESKNPVFMLDEIDKIGADFRGDPAAALLEVLDPEQNKAFQDHYLDLDFDLSKVMFITTANVLDTVSPALLDRMEVLRLPGYTEEEKVKIAKKYLWPKILKEHGINKSQIELGGNIINKVSAEYTHEAGVRNLERELAKIARKCARDFVSKKKKKIKITEEGLSEFLGPQKEFPEVARRSSCVGVATGLAVTAAGGDIIFIEASKMPGKKGFTLTGQLGDVMKESAQTALSLVRSRARDLSVDENFFEKTDIHLHVPAGSVPKDGPSAGIAMTSALASLLTNRLVKEDVALTGEITLSGLVLPIGGVKEKVLAAKRAGIKTIILPARNKGDAEEIDKDLVKGLRFVFVENIDEVLKNALGKGIESRKK